MNKVTKGNLYQNILGAYNIIPSGYAIKYLTPELNEASLMNVIFSKFASDTLYNADNALYIDYIIKSKYVASYDMEYLIANTHYYEDGMSLTDKRDKAKSNPATNADICDFDISSYASAHISSYLFYLDIISEIYGLAYDLKKAKQSIIANQMTLKCRYYYSADNQLLYTLNNTGYFNITLGITREGINNQVTNVEVLSPQPVQAIFNKFNEDIKNHLTFLHGNDVMYADAKYLLEVKYFYMTCRLKLMYFIANSLRILTSKEITTASSNSIVTAYITQYILPVFINYKTKALLLETDTSSSKKNVEFANTVLDTTNKLKKINDKIAKGRNKLVKNQKTRNALQQYIDKKKIINVLAYVILIFVIIVSIILVTTNIGGNSKATLSAILTAVVILAYVIVFSLTRAIEKFEVPIIGGFTKYPRHSAVSNIGVFDPYTVIRMLGSSSLNDDKSFWKAFDGNDSTAWNSAQGTYGMGNAINTIRTDYAGEYLMIDFGEFIVLDNFDLKFGVEGKGPKSFRIYGARLPDAWGDVNNIDWKILSDQTDVEYENAMSKNFKATIENTVCPDFVAYEKELEKLVYNSIVVFLGSHKTPGDIATAWMNSGYYKKSFKEKDTFANNTGRVPANKLNDLKKKYNLENEVNWDCYEVQKQTQDRQSNRFFMIVVNKLSGNQDNVNISALELNGREPSVISISSTIKYGGGTHENRGEYDQYSGEYDITPIKLPFDYDASKVIDLVLSGAYWKIGSNHSSYPVTSMKIKLNILGKVIDVTTSSGSTVHPGNPGMASVFSSIQKQLSSTEDNLTGIISYKGALWSIKCDFTMRYIPCVRKSETKKIILAAIANVGAIDKEALAKAMLDQANADYNKALADITKANNEFNIAKANLQKAIDDQQAKLALENAEFQQQLATANEAKASAERDAAQKLADATAKEADAERERLRLIGETDAKTTAQQRVTELTALNNNAMDAFKTYMTATEQTQYAQAKSENANLAYKIAFDTSTRAIASAQAEAEASNAKSISGYAEIVARKKAAEEATAKANADHAQSVKNHAFNEQLINQLVNIERKGLQDQIAYQIEQLRLANEASTLAEEELRVVQNQATLLVGQMNTQYGFNSSNIDQTTVDLRLQLIQEQKRKADADAEYAQQQIEELRQKDLEATANTAIDENNRLIAEKNNSISFYSAELVKSQERLRLLQERKIQLQGQLRIKLETIGATAQIADADNRLAEMEARTREKINELGIEKAQLIIVYTNRVLQSEIAAKDALEARSNKENLMKELESRTNTKQQYQEEIANSKNAIEDYNIFEILSDVDVHVLYSLNDNINSINNATVIPRLKREHQYYDQYNQAMKNYSFITDSDKNIKTIDGKALDDGTLFLIQLALIIAICCIVYHIASPYVAVFTSIGLFAVIVVIYYINVLSNVRTKAENYYWHKPENSSDT